MIERKVTGENLVSAYHKALLFLSEFGNRVPCPDYDTQQTEIGMTMIVEHPVAEPMISPLTICGPAELEQYRQEMLDGILDFEVERGRWPYTYHQRMAEQIPAVLAELRRNPESRRACITIRRPEDITMPDPPCLQHIQLFIRDGALDMVALFRSNDAVKAAYMNAFALIMLQAKLAVELGVYVGTYTHRANSFHAYERDWPTLKGYRRRIMNHTAIGYSYYGDWLEQMEEARPTIAAKVERMKNDCATDLSAGELAEMQVRRAKDD